MSSTFFFLETYCANIETGADDGLFGIDHNFGIITNLRLGSATHKTRMKIGDELLSINQKTLKLDNDSNSHLIRTSALAPSDFVMFAPKSIDAIFDFDSGKIMKA